MIRKAGDPDDRHQNPTSSDSREESLPSGTLKSDLSILKAKPLLDVRLRNPCQRPYSRGQRGCGWAQKYLFLFCKTWTALFLASVVCSSLAQPHIMEEGETDPYVRYSSYHRDSAIVEGHHLNNSHLLATSETLFHRNRSKSYAARHHRSRPQSRWSPLYRRPNDQLHHQNPAVTSKSLAHSPIEKRQQDRPGRTPPKDVPSADNFSDRLPRALPRSNQQRNRSFHEYSAQNDATQSDDDDVDDSGRPCVYSGHLKTDRSWYGYLANISLAGGTGRLVFEFSYPAESCCLSVLFYHEDQLSIMSARTNCWQKEDLLRPDVDQILRLTPSFSWSGCQVKKRPGGDMMVCKGGRSFTKHSYDFQSTSAKEKPAADDKAGQKHRNSDVASNAAVWYVAVSHCASLRGLNLRYKLKVYGHSVPCQADYGNEDDNSSDRENPWPTKNHNPKQTTNKHENESQKKVIDVKQENSIGLPSSSSSSSSSSHSSSSSYQSHRPSDAAHIHLASDEWPVCTIEGSVNTTHSWFGFIRNLSLIDGGGFRFYFSLPYSMSPMNVLLYHDEDIRKLHWEQICWLKESVIESKHVLERIIDLTSRSIYNGCASKTGANIEGNNLTCRGEKIFSGYRNIYIALSNCRSRDGLLLKYKLEVFGYKDHTMCSGGRSIHSETIVEKLIFKLSVYCSFFLILAVRRIR